MKNKTTSIICVVLLLCLACGLGFAMFLGILHTDIHNFRFSAGTSERLALDREFSYEGINNIDIDADAANIKYIHGSEDSEKIAVKIYASEDKNVDAYTKDENLAISVKNSCRWFCLNFETDRVEITLPEKYAGKFTINSDAGSIESENFSMADYDIRSDAGDIDIPAAKSLRIDSDAGNIKLGSIETIFIDDDAGNIDINECFGSLEIKSDAGNININELQLSHDSSIKSDAGKIRINNAGNVRVETEGDFTKFNINNHYEGSTIKLKISVDAGSVDVN
jgi:hypothetical protein